MDMSDVLGWIVSATLVLTRVMFVGVVVLIVATVVNYLSL